jgi:DNA-binding MarR family transcriptional regulator
MTPPDTEPAVPSEPAGPLASPGFWLHRAALAWLNDLDARLRPLRLTHTQFTLLAATSWLTWEQEPVTQQEIASFASCDRMMASRVLRNLEDRGLLERRADPRNGRIVLVGVTSTGRELVLSAVKAAAQTDAAFFPDADSRARLETQLRSLVEGRRAGDQLRETEQR